MRKLRYTAAFMMSLLISVSAFMPAASFAMEGWDRSTDGDTLYVDEDGNEITEEEIYETLEKSGDFSYSLNNDGNVCIEMCTSKEKDLVIPDKIDGKKVAYLGKKAFGSDPEKSPYETITLPESIEYVSSDNPFLYCSSLKEIILEGNNEYYTVKDGVLYSKDMTELICYPRGKAGSDFTIDSKTTTIGASAIFLTKLKSVTFPSGLVTISHHGVSSNELLAAADLSGTAVTDIDDFAFAGSPKLSEVKLPDSIETIGGGAFSDCPALEDITLPVGLLSVGQSAFANTGLTHIIVPKSVQNIGYSAFGYDIAEDGTETAVSNFTVVGEKGSAAEAYCSDTDEEYGYKNNFAFMTNENYEENEVIKNLDKKIEGDIEYAIVDGNAVILSCTSPDVQLTVPEKLGGKDVTAIYTAAFSNCSSANIILPETVTEIRKGAFYACQYLTNIVLPQSVKTVGEAAFGECPLLVSADLGGAEVIEKSIFENCPMLKSITISGNCKNFNDEEPFMAYTALEEINVTEGGEGSFCSVDGVIYSKDMTMLLAYPIAKEGTEFKVPLSVKNIARSSFANNKNLETIDLSNVEEIGAYAFERCKHLNRVIMSKELTTLGADAFYDCKELKSLRFYDKLENLGTFSFGYAYKEGRDLLDPDDTSNGPEDYVIEDFKVYAKKNSVPYYYAKDSGINVVTGTIEIGTHNVSLAFLFTMAGALLAAILAVTVISVSKKMKKSKEEKKQAKIKAEAAERIKAKKDSEEAADKTEGENEDK